jgi:hypothetical protein
MKIASACGEGIALTLIDPSAAVPFGDIEKIDWRKLHHQLRRRLERCLGRDVVVLGMGEVEADYEKSVWQPHYHLAVFGASSSALNALREKHYAANGDGVRKMWVEEELDAGWFSYLSKLTAFRKLSFIGSDGRERVRRVRLKNRELRQHKVLAIADFGSVFAERLDRIRKIAEKQSSKPIMWRDMDIDAPVPDRGLNIIGITDSDVEVAALVADRAVQVLERCARREAKRNE